MSASAFDFTSGSFFSYFYDHPSHASDAQSLEDCIHLWVIEGVATRACGGSFELYLATVAVIFAKWHDERQACSSEKDWRLSIPWRITRAFNEGVERAGSEVFDPFFFKWSSIPDY
jgi:hypothetical protein